MPIANEIAALTINGQDYTEWETVMVKHTLRGIPPYICKFTCSEGLPIAENFAKLQIKPGDACTVTLAGELAFTGRVETRQVYYDSRSHKIEIQCATFMELATSSVIHRTMEWKDKTFQQIAQEVLKPFGIPLRFEGGPPSYKFPRVSATPGQSVYDFLDDLGRSVPTNDGSMGISYTTDIDGVFVVVMAPQNKKITSGLKRVDVTGGVTEPPPPTPEPDAVIEGRNILIGREIIYNPSMASSVPAISQGPGNNQNWGAKVAHVPYFSETAANSPFNEDRIPAVVRYEMASSDVKALRGRAANEMQWQDADQITVHATVQGWLRPSGGLWRRNQEVIVNSPMLLMHGDVLRARTVTFTQDNQRGSRTELELCNPAAGGKQMPAIR